MGNKTIDDLINELSRIKNKFGNIGFYVSQPQEDGTFNLRSAVCLPHVKKIQDDYRILFSYFVDNIVNEIYKS